MTNQDRIRAALPGYDIGEMVGRGGYGEVLTGMHGRLQRPVAIKQIPPRLANDPAVRRRFAAEARLMASIEHPHVVPVYDYIECDDLCLLVMEFLAGGTVAERFATDGFDAKAAMATVLACASGLEAAHRRGVLHRDVKPANLMFTESGTVKLTDFGIAKIVGGDETLMTRAGEIVGTPAYIAPEQARGQQVSPATDIYALSTMLYQLLSGVLPFPPGDDSMATLFMHAFEEPTPLTDVVESIPEPIAAVVMRALATDPTDRFGSAESFGVALAESSSRCWGPDWLSQSGIAVIGADAILAATTRTSGRTGGKAHTTEATGGSLGPTRPAPTTPVRPLHTLPRNNVDLAALAREDLTPIHHVVEFRSPRLPYVIATVVALAAIALAVLGPGLDQRSEVPPGLLTIAGVDPGGKGSIDVDMTKPIPITVTGARGDAATLALSVLDTAVGRHQAPLTPDGHGSIAVLPPPVNPYMIAGRMTLQLQVLQGGDVAATYMVPAHSTQSSVTTALALAAVIAALFGFAYAESNLRNIRQGRSRVTAIVGLALSSAVLAVAAAAGAWVVMGHQPTAATLVGSSALAAAAGLAAAVGAARSAQRQRYRRTSRARQPGQSLGVRS